jgi:hypothetical protein
MRLIAFIALLTMTAAIAGCGQREFMVVPVKGLVMCKGRPVTEGLVQFSPVATNNPMSGKAGAGEISEDGTFVITTYTRGDGAIVGKCRITAGPNDPKLPWPCKLKNPIEYDVQPGGNNLVIEVLPDGTGKATPAS